MKGKIIVVASITIIISIFVIDHLFFSPVAMVEKINMTPRQYLTLNKDPNIVLVSEEKLNIKFRYAITYCDFIYQQKYKKKHRDDELLYTVAGGELSFLIFSNNLPDPEFIKNWKWKKKK